MGITMEMIFTRNESQKGREWRGSCMHQTGGVSYTWPYTWTPSVRRIAHQRATTRHRRYRTRLPRFEFPPSRSPCPSYWANWVECITYVTSVLQIRFRDNTYTFYESRATGAGCRRRRAPRPLRALRDPRIDIHQ